MTKSDTSVKPVKFILINNVKTNLWKNGFE
jgi:hypothetical protein